MIRRSDLNIKKILISLLILSGLAVSLFSQDKQISGRINVYRRVVGIGPGTDNVTLNNADSISPGDTVLIIQMQGVKIVTTQDSYGFGVQDTIGIPGGYEFLLVQSVVGNKVVFTKFFLNSYDIKGNVQVVRVPYYNSATVTGRLTSKPWNNIDKTGGVLAMIVGRKLKLNAEIDVSGKGFLGGKDTIGKGECVWTNHPANSLDAYPRTWINAGFKGEGLANYDALENLLYPSRMKGQGINLTGGGGGNGKYSGGGGGSNRGMGGLGIDEKYDVSGITGCANPFQGAYGGTALKENPFIKNGIFSGGGGGSSTHASGSSGSNGGAGGGIVVIVADTISGNRKFIKADGETAGNAVGDGGSGGGGGGGSVVLSLQSFSTVANDSLKVSVKGGNGGTNSLGFGNGGGGGGGLFWVSTATIPGKVPVKVNYGIPGPPTTTDGYGETKFNFSPNLNGFLFNSIRSEVTGNQIDSICSDVAFGMMTGTKPVGGVTPYTYIWEKSTTSDVAGFGPATGINNGQNYSPGLLTQTTWFRRKVSDSGGLTDISKPVKIIVQQAITGNFIGKDTTICYNQNPLSLIPLNTGPSNGSSYNYYIYEWQDSIVSSAKFLPAAGTATSPGYDPPALTTTTYYQRKVTSGRCVSYSSVVTITVLPSITGNSTIRSDSVICEGRVFNNLASSAPAGGDLLYIYQWQDSTTSGNWSPASGTNNGSIYSPDTSAFSSVENRFFRRIVYSGADNVCSNKSSRIMLTRYHKIKNNSILDNQTICSGSTPAALSGLNPTSGAGSYSFLWVQSINGTIYAPASGTNNSLSGTYQPPSLTDTTWYRRIVHSGIYKSAPICTDTSLFKRIAVHKPILNNIVSLISGAGPDTTICSGAIPDSIIGSKPSGGTELLNDYAYLWERSTTSGLAGFSTAPGANTGKSYKPGSLTQTAWFRRKAISGMCGSFSNSIRVIVLPPITNNVISGNQTVCYNTAPLQLTGTSLTGGAGGTPAWAWQESSDGLTWIIAAGPVNNQQNYSPPPLTIPMMYRRIIRSGLSDCCIDTSNTVSVGIHPPLPTGTITSILDTTICEGSKVRLRIHLTGESKWKVVYNENSSQVTVNSIAGSDTTVLASPLPGAAVTIFNYSLFSVEDKNGCFATATSLTGARKADVYRNPVAVAGGPLAEICGPTITLKATPSVGTGTWYYPPEVIASTLNNPTVTVTVDSTFAGSSIAPWFVWEEKNWQCPDKDSVKVTFYKRVYSINAGPDTTLYTFDNIIHMVADPVLSWETGVWTLVSGTGEFNDSSDNLTDVNNLSKGTNIFLWKVTNGSCSLEDLVNVEVFDLLIPKGFSPNNDNFNNTFVITGLDLPNQIAELTVVNGAGTEIFSTSNRDSQTWIDWDGKNLKGIDLPEGTYYYLLKITSRGNGTVLKKSGFIVLKRY
jgi:gliding motility-associated-like protein